MNIQTRHRASFFKPLSAVVAIVLLLGFLSLTCFSGVQKRSLQAKEVQEETAGEILQEGEAGGVKKAVFGSQQSSDFPLHLFFIRANRLCFFDVYWVTHHFVSFECKQKNAVELYLLYCCLKVFS